MLTPDDINEIRRRCEAATPGEWTWEADPATVYAGRGPYMHGLNLFGRLEPDSNGRDNLNFICAARQDVPALLSALAEREAEVERLRGAARPIVELISSANFDAMMRFIMQNTPANSRTVNIPLAVEDAKAFVETFKETK